MEYAGEQSEFQKIGSEILVDTLNSSFSETCSSYKYTSNIPDFLCLSHQEFAEYPRSFWFFFCQSSHTYTTSTAPFQLCGFEEPATAPELLERVLGTNFSFPLRHLSSLRSILRWYGKASMLS